MSDEEEKLNDQELQVGDMDTQDYEMLDDDYAMAFGRKIPNPPDVDLVV